MRTNAGEVASAPRYGAAAFWYSVSAASALGKRGERVEVLVHQQHVEAWTILADHDAEHADRPRAGPLPGGHGRRPQVGVDHRLARSAPQPVAPELVVLAGAFQPARGVSLEGVGSSARRQPRAPGRDRACDEIASIHGVVL